MNVAVPTLPQPSFASSFTPLKEVGPPKSFLLYGATGTRKTSMIGELVASGRFKRVLVFDFDNGTEVFANDPSALAAVEDGRISIFGIDSLNADAFQMAEQAIFEVCGVYRDALGDLRANPNIPDFGYDLVLIDTLNLLQGVAVKHFLRTTFNEKGQPDTRGAWGKVGVWTDEIARLFQNTKRFTGAIVMHPMTEEDKTGVLKTMPKLAGAMKSSISTIPSLCVHLGFEKHPETGQTVLAATMGESESVDAKNRYRLPSKIYDFSLVDLYRTIDGRGVAAPVAAPPSVAAAAPPALPTIPAAVAA